VPLVERLSSMSRIMLSAYSPRAAGEGICPRCHGMDIEDGSPNERQQKAEAAQGGG